MTSAALPASDDPASHAMLGRRLGLTAKTVRRFVEHRLQGAGATLSTVILCRALTEEPGLSQRELADRMDIEGPTLLRHVDRMEQNGLLVRERDPVDRRKQRVTLTAQGRAAHRRLERVARRADDDLTSVLTPAERRTLERLLDRLAAHARAQLAAEVDA